ncbi:hypothetical protein ACKGJY_14805 [Hyunsoonleella sp. 2307UL5-6]|uniref:hypothetical protein n=1 Tax=Hyunsoonleella sp. 2307UL5-6 TaxID=3384768 RepID=UPI0039BCD0A8
MKSNLDQYLKDLKAFHEDVQDMLQNAPSGMDQLAYVDYENRVAEVLNFTNDDGAMAIADMFTNEIARNNFLKLQHHQAITDSAHDILETGFAEGLEFTKMVDRDPEGLRLVNQEVAEISAIDDIAEDIGENGSSFWPQNAEEWQAFGEMMVPLLGEILIGFTPAGDYYDLLNSIDSGDVLGASLAIGGIIISSTSLGPIKGAIKGARAFRKALKLYRKVRGVLGAVSKVTKKGYQVVVEAGQLVLKKAGEVIARGDDAVKKLLRALDKTLDAIYDTQKGVIDKFRGNTIKGASRNAKGVFGEVATDVKFAENGFEALHIRKGQNGDLLDGWGESGIDHVFRKDGKFYIIESKYGSARLGNTLDGKQMSDNWIRGGTRLLDAVGPGTASDILRDGYIRVLSTVTENGTTVLKKLDRFGNVIGIFTFN